VRFGCAALLPDLAVAVAAVASLAPYGAEGFDYFAGMGANNTEGFELFFTDPEAYRRELREDREKILAHTPEQFAEAIESLLSPVDAEVLTEDLARWLTETQQVALAAGDQGWWDDGAAPLTSGGVRSGRHPGARQDLARPPGPVCSRAARPVAGRQHPWRGG
jgi:hypothetical protein